MKERDSKLPFFLSISSMIGAGVGLLLIEWNPIGAIIAIALGVGVAMSAFRIAKRPRTIQAMALGFNLIILFFVLFAFGVTAFG